MPSSRATPMPANSICESAVTIPMTRMPPPDSKLSLTKEEITLIREWIQQGAPWQQHWSFVPVQDVDVPQFES